MQINFPVYAEITMTMLNEILQLEISNCKETLRNIFKFDGKLIENERVFITDIF